MLLWLAMLCGAAMYKNEATLSAEIKQMDYHTVHKERINIEKMLKEMEETEVVDTVSCGVCALSVSSVLMVVRVC